MNLSLHEVQQVLYRQQQMDEAQRAAVAAHPQASAQRLAALGVADPLWLALVEQHHEFIDGSGYPQRLATDAVAREAQVIGLADRYCGVVTERAYRPAIAPDVAMHQIRSRSGAAIDSALIAELTHWIGLYPPGTVVELFNREVAVVARRLRDPRHPVVYAVAGQNLRPFDAPKKRMTASQPQWRIERVFPRETIAFPVDPEALWPRTVVDEVATA
jgi:HD-GYP domain-containing protein (c-di-GMP phosphodiesterase class II)